MRKKYILIYNIYKLDHEILSNDFKLNNYLV